MVYVSGVEVKEYFLDAAEEALLVALAAQAHKLVVPAHTNACRRFDAWVNIVHYEDDLSCNARVHVHEVDSVSYNASRVVARQQYSDQHLKT